MKQLAAALVLCLTALSVAATPAAAQRQRLSMDPGWRFTLGDPAGAERPGFDDRQWRRLDLPHDWSIEGAPRQDAPAGGRGGYFPTGIGWYRKAFRLPPGARARETSIEFDGIHMNGEVWINGHHLGRRPYGYSSVAYDVTAHLVPGINVVAVRVDNAAQPNSRWYTGSGIYRHTWLTLVDRLRVAHWGTFVTTPRVDSAGALTSSAWRMISQSHRAMEFCHRHRGRKQPHRRGSNNRDERVRARQPAALRTPATNVTWRVSATAE